MSKFKLYDIILCKSNKNINIFHKNINIQYIILPKQYHFNHKKHEEHRKKLRVLRALRGGLQSPSVVGYSSPWWFMRISYFLLSLHSHKQ